MRNLLLICLIIFFVHRGKGQGSKLDPILAKGEKIVGNLLTKEIDTNYIEVYNLFTLKISAQNRFNAFGLNDGRTGNRIRYIPDIGVTLGIGGATNAFAFDINTQIGISQNQISSTNYTDIQFRFFTSQHYLRLRYQYYLGYKLAFDSSSDQIVLSQGKERGDLRTLQFGMQYLYAINSSKFSIKAPFALNERQKKSAGSLVTGFDFVVYNLNADSSIVPKELEQKNAAWNGFSDMSMTLISANFGYMHSFVIKDHFFFTTSIIPGAGIKSGDYRQDERKVINRAFFWRINSMNAIGYNGDRFAMGLQFNIGYNYLTLDKNLFSNIVEGRSSLYFGYRL